MKGIALKLWAGMMSMVVIMLLLLWSFQIVFLDKIYVDRVRTDVKKQAAFIAEDISLHGLENIGKWTEELSYKSKMDIFDTQGSIIYTNEQRGPMMHSMLDAESFNRVMKGESVSVTRTHPRLQSDYIIAGMPIQQAGNIKMGLFISTPLAAVRETTGILKQQLLYISLVLLVVALLLAYILSRVFTKPILQITAAANKMASGNLSVRLSHKSHDEIGRLAASFNYLAEQLSKVEQLRKDLIANVSHELRTPLSIIRGYAETIRDVSGDNKEKRDRQLGIIIEESERLGGIVDDILNLSQMQAGYMNLRTKAFRLDSTLQSIAGRYDVLSQSTGIKVSLESAGNVEVDADEERISQVLYNLINNAFNYSPKGGCIKVKSVDKGDFIRIEVSDNGPGIPHEALGQIWERYFKADRSSGRRQIGTGLGLAIVKSILEAHNCRFGVESKLGQGTTFWFELKKTLLAD